MKRSGAEPLSVSGLFPSQAELSKEPLRQKNASRMRFSRLWNTRHYPYFLRGPRVKEGGREGGREGGSERVLQQVGIRARRARFWSANDDKQRREGAHRSHTAKQGGGGMDSHEI